MNKTEQLLQQVMGSFRSGQTVVVLVPSVERARYLLKSLRQDHVPFAMQHAIVMDLTNLELRMVHGRGQVRFYTLKHPEVKDGRITSYPSQVPHFVDGNEDV